MALLLRRALPVPFAVVYAAASVPFLVLAAARLGAAFTARSPAAVAAVAFSLVHPHAFTVASLSPVYATPVGNLAVGVGLLVLFRHRTSLGGFGVVALVVQERLGGGAAACGRGSLSPGPRRHWTHDQHEAPGPRPRPRARRRGRVDRDGR